MLKALLITFAVIAVLVLGVVAVIAFTLRRLVRDLQSGLDDLRRETLPLLDQTRTALSKATTEDRRADALLDAATSLTGTADAASRFAYRMVTNPFVKVIAFFTGTKRAVKALGDATSPGGRADRQLQAKRRDLARRRAISTPSVESAQRPQVAAREGEE
jgi:hypothetical protein